MRKQVLVTVDRGETRVAIIEGKGARTQAQREGGRPSRTRQVDPDWRVAELYIERRGRRSIVGNIYKGRVDNVLPAWRRRSSTSDSRRTASCTSTRSSRRESQTQRAPRPRPQGGPRISDL